MMSSAAVDFCFAGMYRHPESGLKVTWFRQYFSPLGRWLSRDPLGGSNLYNYVANNPISFVDPLGLAWGDSMNANPGTILEGSPQAL